MITGVVRIVQDRMDAIGMSRATLATSAGIARSQIDRYLNGTVVPSVIAWEKMMTAVGLDVDAKPSATWSRAERAERASRRAQLLEMQGADQDAGSVTLELFLSEQIA
jgi:transcriptional regulator with XRE-family HTH domain